MHSHAPGRQASRQIAGFTLLEVAMVLTIIGILSAIAVPRYVGFVTGQRADAAARRITIDLAMAQQNARVTSQSRTVSFDVGLDKYEMPGIPDPENAGSDYTVYLAKEPYTATITEAEFDASPDLVIDGYGVLQSNGSIVIRVGSYQRTITLTPGASVHGLVLIQKGKVSK